MQWVMDAVPLDLPVIQVAWEDTPNIEAAVHDLLVRGALEPFDLETGPVLRARLLALAPDDHVLALTFHHIVSDAWSIEVAFRDVCLAYAAACRGTDPAAALPASPVQYADYAIWQNERLAAGEFDSQRDYWLRQLGEDLPILDLPTDRPRPPVQSFSGRRLQQRLPHELRRRLEAVFSPSARSHSSCCCSLPTRSCSAGSRAGARC